MSRWMRVSAVIATAFALACSPSFAEAPASAPAVDSSANPDAWIHFGAPFTLASAVPAASVFGDPESHVGKTVRVTGELTEVCQKAGCWAVIRDDQGHSYRITMKDHAFGIAKDGAGRKVDLEGQFVKKDVDPAAVEHYKSEGSTHPPEEGQAVSWEIVASSVWVARS